MPPRCSTSGRTPTQIEPPVDTSEIGCPLTGVVRTIALRFGSMRDTVAEYWLATQTDPWATAIAAGLLPTGIVAATAPRSGSIREIVESSEFATQTPPAPTASATGPFPTLAVARVSCVRRSIWATEPAS